MGYVNLDNLEYVLKKSKRPTFSIYILSSDMNPSTLEEARPFILGKMEKVKLESIYLDIQSRRIVFSFRSSEGTVTRDGLATNFMLTYHKLVICSNNLNGSRLIDLGDPISFTDNFSMDVPYHPRWNSLLDKKPRIDSLNPKTTRYVAERTIDALAVAYFNGIKYGPSHKYIRRDNFPRLLQAVVMYAIVDDKDISGMLGTDECLRIIDCLPLVAKEYLEILDKWKGEVGYLREKNPKLYSSLKQDITTLSEEPCLTD